MSSTPSDSSTPSSSSPTASSSPSPTDKPLGLNSTSNLYLVTFLATLFLLLFISCAIVLRSYVMRRRFQRRLDEAMAAGIVLTPRALGSRKRRFGIKPRFYTSWLAQGGEKWDEMMPVSALPVQAKRRCKHATTEISNTPQPSCPNTVTPPFSDPVGGRFLRAIRWRDQISNETPSPVREKPPRQRVDMLQISVLIAMPTPTRPINSSRSSLEKFDNDEDEDRSIPDVVFGITRLPYKQPNRNMPS